MSGATLRLDEQAVAHNVGTLLAGSNADLMAVVKADGFGLGARSVARAALAGGARSLGVTSLAEAAEVTDLGVRVLSWLNPVDADFGDPATAEVEVAVGSLAHLDAVVDGARSTATVRRVHLYVDTGMHRDGCPRPDWPTLCRRARRAEVSGTVQVVGIMGHLGCTDPDDLCHVRANARFNRSRAVARALGLRPQVSHLAATAAALDAPLSHHDLLRVGAGLVGIDPTGQGRLRPVATLEAPVVQTRRVRAGETVGYGHQHRVDRDGTVALLPIGYADGLPRAASAGGEVWLAGRRRRLLGLVSMDQCVVDLADDAVAPGTLAVVFGPGPEHPTVADWAAWAGTIEHEILTGIGPRVHREPSACSGRVAA